VLDGGLQCAEWFLVKEQQTESTNVKDISRDVDQVVVVVDTASLSSDTANRQASYALPCSPVSPV